MTALFTAIILGMGAGVRQMGGLLKTSPTPATCCRRMGWSGLVAIAVTVAVGVWVSVRISIGSEAARSNPSFTWWVVNRLAFLVGTTNLSTFAVYFLQGRLGLCARRPPARPHG